MLLISGTTQISPRVLLFALLLIIGMCSMCTVRTQGQNFSLSATDYPLLPIPFKVVADGLNVNSDSTFIQVYRNDKSGKVLLKSQVQQGEPTVLWVTPDKTIEAGSKVEFSIASENSMAPTPKMPNVSIDNTDIHLTSGNQPVLDYRHAVLEAPPEADPLFRKSGYIHPLYSPSGNILTRIQAPDHYHHYGIWNPWTKTKVRGEEVDFWNLLLGQGTVRYAGLLSKSSGKVYSDFKIKQEHVTFQNKGADEVVINEVWEVRSFPVEIDGKTCWMIDMIIKLNNALDSTIELTDYRYGGGIGFRATEHWTNQNSKVLTSEGKTRKDADGTFARWCKVEGAFPSGTNSGIVFFSHPENRAHPEPMRVWPVDANGGRGDLFFEFCPIRHQKWDLLPNKEYVLKYRMLVFDGEFPAEYAESIWQTFAHGVSINWETNSKKK